MNRRASSAMCPGPASVQATGFKTESAVLLNVGDNQRGERISVFMPPHHARKLGAALIAAADHYDAETERLAQEDA